MANDKGFTECFWSEASATKAAAKFRAHWSNVKVIYAMLANGSHEWIVKVTY